MAHSFLGLPNSKPIWQIATSASLIVNHVLLRFVRGHVSIQADVDIIISGSHFTVSVHQHMRLPRRSEAAPPPRFDSHVSKSSLKFSRQVSIQYNPSTKLTKVFQLRPESDPGNEKKLEFPRNKKKCKTKVYFNNLRYIYIEI